MNPTWTFLGSDPSLIDEMPTTTRVTHDKTVFTYQHSSLPSFSIRLIFLPTFLYLPANKLKYPYDNKRRRPCLEDYVTNYNKLLAIW